MIDAREKYKKALLPLWNRSGNQKFFTTSIDMADYPESASTFVQKYIKFAQNAEPEKISTGT